MKLLFEMNEWMDEWINDSNVLKMTGKNRRNDMQFIEKNTVK